MITISFVIPLNSINYWIDRFKNQEIHFQGPTKRFDNEEVLPNKGAILVKSNLDDPESLRRAIKGVDSRLYIFNGNSI